MLLSSSLRGQCSWRHLFRYSSSIHSQMKSLTPMYLFTYPNTTSLLQVSIKDESVSNGSTKINGVLLNSSKSTNNSTNNSGSNSTKAGKSSAPSVVDCCEASTMTDPNLLGPCQPGTAVKLQGAVLQESEKGKMFMKQKICQIRD